MNATRQARRSDALYHDETGTITRRWLCDRIGAVEDYARDLLRALAQEDRTGRLYGIHETVEDMRQRARQLGLED